ncbi:hypothetical protein NUH88_20490 [Nisaea acidiphila]|uniref:Uncharacterized protein n=1 Tax=Nisaea acidiphila TaxID=1862145 RepID=A0A9J7ATF2_9PROT|nr:hypothetical protein [Nisaea acidiphila]UUX49761.1 hypothetical protein NUH88_20490 [Nisaea acidiphila]
MSPLDRNDPAPDAAQNFSWSIDREQKLLLIEIRDGFSDYDLLKYIPRIWEDNPEVIWCNTVVDHRGTFGPTDWTWGALEKLGKQWAEFEQGQNPGTRVAIVTDNYWLTLLVNKALGFIFPGSRFRCFKEIHPAMSWAADDEAPEED